MTISSFENFVTRYSVPEWYSETIHERVASKLNEHGLLSAVKELHDCRPENVDKNIYGLGWSKQFCENLRDCLKTLGRESQINENEFSLTMAYHILRDVLIEGITEHQESIFQFLEQRKQLPRN